MIENSIIMEHYVTKINRQQYEYQMNFTLIRNDLMQNNDPHF